MSVLNVSDQITPTEDILEVPTGWRSYASPPSAIKIALAAFPIESQFNGSLSEGHYHIDSLPYLAKECSGVPAAIIELGSGVLQSPCDIPFRPLTFEGEGRISY
jgi:hypothetical protein